MVGTSREILNKARVSIYEGSVFKKEFVLRVCNLIFEKSEYL